MHDVTKKHGSLSAGRNDNDRATRRMARGAPDINAWQDRHVLAPGLEPVQDRGKQLRRASATHHRDGQTVIEWVGAHKEFPVRLVATVGCLVEEAAMSIGGPSEMVEMKMGQDDIGNL